MKDYPRKSTQAEALFCYSTITANGTVYREYPHTFSYLVAEVLFFEAGSRLVSVASLMEQLNYLPKTPLKQFM